MRHITTALALLLALGGFACAAPTGDEGDESDGEEATGQSEDAVSASCLKFVSANTSAHDWVYQNTCSSTVRAKLDVALAPDTGCKSVASRAVVHFTPITNAVRGPKLC